MREYTSEHKYNIKGRGIVFLLRTFDSFTKDEVIRIDGKAWQVVDVECVEKPGFGRCEEIGVVVKEPVIKEEIIEAPKKPRLLSLVKFTKEYIDWMNQGPVEYKNPPLDNMRFVYMGEIPNMPGHCVAYDLTNKHMQVGYHPEHFVELSAEEV